ncbi:MAG: ABC transporter substrate-binding protein, partial [Selenomonadaceae bacterium]|nr:ABC transporter substrate-binding protein [Selenomonadaceae bacterium]
GKKVDGTAVKKCLEALITNHDRAPKDLKIDSIEADGQFVTIKSKEKVPALLNYLSDPYGCIVDVDAGITDDIAIGTGAYKAVKVTDTQIELVPNENYWGEVKPKLERIIVKSITDGDTLTMAMQNGEFDAVQGLPYSSLKLFADGYKISQADTSRVYQIAFNFDTPELQDINVRRAISMAIDKDNFTKVLLEGNGTAAVGAFPANMTFGGDKVKAAPYNLDEAKKLLAESGWQDTNGDGYVDKDGKNLELRYLTYTLRPELAMLAGVTQADLKLIGIKLDVNATNDYRHFLAKGEYDLYCNSIVTAPTGDPEYYFMTNSVSDSPTNMGHYKSEEFDAMAKELHNTFGTANRNALAVKMMQKILDDCAMIYVSRLQRSLVMKPNISGLTAHPSDYYEITADLRKN